MAYEQYPPVLPAHAVWKRYPLLAARMLAEPAPHGLEARIVEMLQKAHETGAAAMRDRCIAAVRKLEGRRFHSRKVLALACIEAMRKLPSEGGVPPTRYRHKGSRKPSFMNQAVALKRPELAGLTRSQVGKYMAAHNNARKEGSDGPVETDAMAADRVHEPVR
jgi:hypothetical protein